MTPEARNLANVLEKAGLLFVSDHDGEAEAYPSLIDGTPLTPFLEKAVVLLTPAQAPDKAGEREGVVRALDKALDAADYLADRYKALWQGETVRDLPEAEASYDAASKGLVHAYSLAHQPTGTEASRSVGTDKDACKAAWMAYRYGTTSEPATWEYPYLDAAWNAAWKACADHLAATPTPPLAPDSMGPAGDEDDAEVNRILAMSDAEVIAEIEAEGRDPVAVAETLRGQMGATFRLCEEIKTLRDALAGNARVDAILKAMLTPAGDPEHGDRDHIPRVLRDFLSEACGRAGLTAFNDGYAEGYAKAQADAALTPSAPIAAPVRGDGAREALEYARQLLDACMAEFGLDDHEDADEEAVGGGADGDIEITFGHMRRLRNALASLPAPAGDVPGEAQTQEGGR